MTTDIDVPPDDVTGIVGRRMRADRIPGLSLAVVADGALQWTAGYGLADLASGAQVRPETAFLWFSMTKIVTATAAMQLAEQGLLDLDAPVNTYLPMFKNVVQPRPVTVRHLLSHSSGLANPLPIRWVYPAGSPPPDRREFVEKLLRRHRRLRAEPGVRARYSNLGYLVLGEAIAQASGQPYEHYVHQHILDRLGMRHTGFAYQPSAPCPPATGYQRLARGLTPLLRAALPPGIVAGRHGPYAAYRPFYVAGASYGGLVGPVTDAARLVLLHLGDGSLAGQRPGQTVRLLSAESATQMRATTARGGPLDFGLGWYRRHADVGEPAFVEHLGGGSGFFCAMRLYPRKGFGIVLMTNTTSFRYRALLSELVSRS